MAMAMLCLIAIGGPVALVGVFLRGMRRMPTRPCASMTTEGMPTRQGVVDSPSE